MKNRTAGIIESIIGNMKFEYSPYTSSDACEEMDFYNTGDFYFDKIEHVKSENSGSTYREWYKGYREDLDIEADILVKATEHSDPDDPDSFDLFIFDTDHPSGEGYRHHKAYDVVEGVVGTWDDYNS